MNENDEEDSGDPSQLRISAWTNPSGIWLKINLGTSKLNSFFQVFTGGPTAKTSSNQWWLDACRLANIMKVGTPWCAFQWCRSSFE
jgi:hypothetical protein